MTEVNERTLALSSEILLPNSSSSTGRCIGLCADLRGSDFPTLILLSPPVFRRWLVTQERMKTGKGMELNKTNES